MFSEREPRRTATGSVGLTLQISHLKVYGKAMAIGLFENKCPRCGTGEVFSSLVKMREDCPSCHLHYEREPGYFLGAMSFSYIAGFLIALPTFLWLLFNDYSLLLVVLIPVLQVAPFAPFLFRYSRLLYLHLDRSIDKSAHL